MTITAQNVAILIAEKNNIQPGIHNAMLEVGQLPLICHVINTISRLNFCKIIIAHDKIFSQEDMDKTLLFAGNAKPLIGFVNVDFEQDSEIITKSIFQHLPDNANNILLINSNAPFVRAYSVYAALAALDSQHNDTLLLPSLVVLGVKYNKAAAVIKNFATEEYKQDMENSSSIVMHNTSVIIAHAKILEKIMSVSIRQNQEMSINNIIVFALQNSITAAYVEVPEEEIVAIESNKHLLIAESIFQKKIRHQMIEQGVKMIAPDTVFFTANTKIASNVIIHPYVVFGNDVVVESGSEIKSFSHIEGAYLEENTSIGPFARIRPHSNIKKYAKVGSFVEIKQSSLDPYSKVAHLSYIGNTNIGEATNIGAGTVTCNYDGINKHQTNIGQNCFIGANTNFIAPINIGNNVLIGAGSVITDDIQDNEFAVARSKQKNKKNKYTKIKTIAPTDKDA